MSPPVSLVIVNYNGQDLLPSCLESIRSQSRTPHEVVVVDNASTDASLRLLHERYPEVRVEALPGNVGFAAACNHGIQKSSGELVAILNNDIVLDPGWLAALLREVSPRWSLWASQIVFSAAPDRIDSAGDGMAVVGAAYKIGHGEPASRHQRKREVFGPCAAAALYRRSLLEEIGGFDDDFFLIYEDGDLNLRARLAGHRCLFVPEARVTHMVNTSIGRLSHNYVYYGHRNSEFVFWKGMPMPLLLIYLPERLLFDLLCLIYFGFKGRAGSYLRAKAAFLKAFPGVWRKRRSIQATRVIQIRELRRLLQRNWFKSRANRVPAL